MNAVQHTDQVELSWRDRLSLMAMFLAPAIAFGVWAVTVHTQLAVNTRDIDRHEIVLTKLVENQTTVVRVLDRLETRVQSHLENNKAGK